MAIMISKNLKCSSYRFVVVLLLLGTLLTSLVGRVQPVYALAELAPEIAPVYDTTIVQLSDYVENNLTQSQGDIFYILLGLALSGYAGSSDYELVNPNSSQGGVLNWLKDCGAQFYNTLITSPFTNGLFIAPDGTDMTKYVSTWLSISMGYAMKASAYSDVDDFLADVNSQDKYGIPLNYESMFAMNCILGKHNGLYDWQFQETEWTSNFVWDTTDAGSLSVSYLELVQGLNPPTFKYNRSQSYSSGYYTKHYNCVAASPLGSNIVLFLNTLNGQFRLVDIGNDSYSQSYTVPTVSIRDRWGSNNIHNYNVNSTDISFFYSGTLTLLNYDSLVDAVDYIYQDAHFTGGLTGVTFDLSELTQTVYIGTDLTDRSTWSILHRTSDLNFLDVNTQYFLTRQDTFLLDIKGLLEDLVGVTKLLPTFTDNIYDLDGTLIYIDDLFKVSIDALIQALADPPIPVNLNDIAEYTQNDYLDELKEHAKDFGETIGEYVAFWHNSNYEITYVLLGSIIIIMIGAFIGKWGHS